MSLTSAASYYVYIDGSRQLKVDKECGFNGKDLQVDGISTGFVNCQSICKKYVKR
jgi:hypothetical protein